MFDFKNIDRDNIYTGNIMMISFVGALGTKCAFQYVVAKTNVVLIKVSDEYYIDIDGVKTLNDCNIINEMLERKVRDNNILLNSSLDEPYIGKMFLTDIKKLDKIKSNIDIMKLKLVSKDTQ